MRKLLEFDFSAAVDGAVRDGAAKIGATEDEVLAERIVECKPHGKISTAESRGARLARL
ncbi:hypothetical protein DVH24_042712 [Malus domestica]|uniref:Uncharacterized protein n=1 Tax=Malus domestica TaxID=3750 RepID=A0A498I1S7_MALDO|nr:hypothetical protein DVH24_042712 [Malus domestica]